MFSAKDAKEMCGLTVEEKVEKLCNAIKEMLENEKKEGKELSRRLATSWQYREDLDLWVDGGYAHTKEWDRACKILRDLGYKVEFYYTTSQFVDMYTLVEW